MNYKVKHKNILKKQRLIIIILIIFLVITIGISIWAIFLKKAKSVLPPDYAPRQTEENAEPFLEDSDGNKLQQQAGGGAVSMTYSKDVTINLSDKIVTLMFANPNKSNQDMVIQVTIQDTIVAESGLLVPGYKVTELNLLDNIELSGGGKYEGNIEVMFYQEDTGEKAMLSTKIPVTINIVE